MSPETQLRRGIASIGAYVPRYRLTADAVTDAWGEFHGAGISETAVPAGDEDTLTMGYEAATRALSAADIEPEAVSTVLIGTTTPPVEEEAMAPRLVSLLGLSETAECRQLTGSTQAGVDSLIAGLRTDRDGPVLAVATDAPRGEPDTAVEHASGAGAVAAMLTGEAPGTVSSVATATSPYPGTRFRQSGSETTTGLGVTSYDRTAFTQTVGALSEKLDAKASVDAAAVQSPNGKLPYRAAGALGVETEQIERGTVVHRLGDLGTASSLCGLAVALADGAKRVLTVGYGSGGGATGFVLSDEGIDLSVEPLTENETTQLDYPEYLRMRGDITPGEPDGGGAYVSVPDWKRTIPQRHRLVAGSCPDCGTLSFPPEGTCAECGLRCEYEPVSLPGTGTVEAVTVIGQGGAPPEFVEQQARSGAYASAVVALDGPDGETVSVPTQVVDTDPASVTIGDRVTATIRRIYTQEGLTRYGFKMRPLA